MTMAFIARWYPRPEKLEDFLGVIAQLGAGFPPEIAAGITLMQPTLNRDGQFVVLEVWKDEAILNRLRESKLFHDAIRNMSACCSRPCELEHLNPLGERSNVFERYPSGKAHPAFYPDLGSMTAIYR
ncbi:MAG: antibiotic biosynthesis monooxygenase [Steroidobacteraceae bacterium]